MLRRAVKSVLFLFVAGLYLPYATATATATAAETGPEAEPGADSKLEAKAEVTPAPKPDVLAPVLYEQCFADVSFGEDRATTIKTRAERIRTRYQERMLAERDAVEKDALKKRMKEVLEALSLNSTDFDGKALGYNASVIGRDFAQNAGESLYVVEKGRNRVYFFYGNDKLWKVAIVIGGGVDYDALSEQLAVLYGPGKRGAMPRDGASFVTTWTSKRIRMTLSDEQRVFKAYVLRWTDLALEKEVMAFRKRSGVTVGASAPRIDHGEEDILGAALEDGGDAHDNVVDDILGKKPAPIPDVAGANKKNKPRKAKQAIPKPPRSQ